MNKLSIIIPFVNEFPSIMYTVQSIWHELRDSGIDFEVLVIDNWCKKVEEQGQERDRGSEYMESIAEIHPWLTYLPYDKKLSHWQCKNHAVALSTGDFLWFCDCHCAVSPGSLIDMYKYYLSNENDVQQGSIHLPISYFLDARGRDLIYKLDADKEKGIAHYVFSRMGQREKPFIVPCMSTCGMMITRKLYNTIGGWPEELGIYGGGENFINFTLSVLDRPKTIFPADPLYHFSGKHASRGYHWYHDDWTRNRAIAAFVHGGRNFCYKFLQNAKGRRQVLDEMFKEVTTNPSIVAHRALIEKQQILSIDDWIDKWK